jgi:cyclic pyranopterin phosphate synthase
MFPSRDESCAFGDNLMLDNQQNPEFSHIDSSGRARMVDVGHKEVQRRFASASCRVQCEPATLAALRSVSMPKGDVLTVAKIAGIQAAKRTDSLIPLCHQIPLSVVNVDITLNDGFVEILCGVVTDAKTGVEMEALVGASVAALTVYDMCKAADKTMVVSDLRVVEKTKK